MSKEGRDSSLVILIVLVEKNCIHGERENAAVGHRGEKVGGKEWGKSWSFSLQSNLKLRKGISLAIRDTTVFCKMPVRRQFRSTDSFTYVYVFLFSST